MLETFFSWYQNELKNRGYCPGNWKWILPPFFSSTQAYMRLNKMIEYTIKPTLIANPGPRVFLKESLEKDLVMDSVPMEKIKT
jgi:hypothetical protein